MEITIEVTSNCQAKCPGCIRHKVFNPDTELVSNPPKNLNLPVDVHKRFIDEIADKVEFLTYDGSFGDSPFHPDFLELIEYSASNCTKLTDLTISTNGSYKTTAFWKGLGEILHKYLPNNHHVMFDLDGIDNKTQNMYRIGTDYDKVIQNAEAFSSGGGNAVWKMIPFDFNEDLVDQAKELALKHNFSHFQRNRISRVEQKAVEIALSNELGVLDKMKENDEDLMNISDEQINTQIETASELIKTIKIDKNLDIGDNLENAREQLGITCIWAEADRYQISHDGSVWRCCWTNSNYQYKTEFNSGERENWVRFTEKYNEGWNNLHFNSFSDIIKHDFFTKDLEESFSNKYDDDNNPKLKVCTSRCSNLNVKLTKRGIW